MSTADIRNARRFDVPPPTRRVRSETDPTAQKPAPNEELDSRVQEVSESAIPTELVSIQTSEQRKLSLPILDPSAFFDPKQLLSSLCKTYGNECVSDALEYLKVSDIRFNNSLPTFFQFPIDEIQEIMKQIALEPTTSWKIEEHSFLIFNTSATPNVTRKREFRSESIKSPYSEPEGASFHTLKEEFSEPTGTTQILISPNQPGLETISEKELDTSIAVIEAPEAPDGSQKESEKSSSSRSEEAIDSSVQGVEISKRSERTESVRENEGVKIFKKIGDCLVGLLIRLPVKAVYENQTMVQQAYHVEQNEGVYSVIFGTTLSAELQKEYKGITTLANHASITCTSKSGNTSVVCSRSSRCDSRETIIAKSIGDIDARLRSTKKNGLSPWYNEKNEQIGYTYQAIHVSFLDQNLLKSLGTTAKSISKTIVGDTAVIENERLFLENKRAAIEALWPDPSPGEDEKNEPYIVHKIKINEGILLVKEYKPLLFNLVFSEQANGEGNIKNARSTNIKNLLTLMGKIIEKLNIDDQMFKDSFEMCYNASKKGKVSEVDLQELAHRLNLIAAIGNKKEWHAYAKYGLAILISGKDINGVSCDRPEDVSSLYIYLLFLAEVLNLGVTIECKSGNDRTCTAMALSCAFTRFKEQLGERFYPPNCPPKSNEFNFFCEFFTQAIIDFGIPNVLASRGSNELKIRKSPPAIWHAGIMGDDGEIIRGADGKVEWRAGLQNIAKLS